MSRQVALIIAGIAGVVALALVVHLWRWTRSHRGRWGPAETLAALGLLLSLVGIVLPLVSTSGQSGESPEVRSYRQHVASTCTALQSSSNPVVGAMGQGGEIDRDRLQQGLRAQLTASTGVLDQLWSGRPPAELKDQVALARADADALVEATSTALDRMPQTLPRSMTFQDFADFAGRLDAELRPKASAMQASLSDLAGAPCRSPSPAGT